MRCLKGNARRRGRSSVRVRRADTDVQLEVEDNGQGFPADGERLFEPYVTTRAKGTGLGLAIVKKIMEEHGGIGRTACRRDGRGAGAARLPDARQLIAAQGGRSRAGRVASGRHKSAGIRPGT